MLFAVPLREDKTMRAVAFVHLAGLTVSQFIYAGQALAQVSCGDTITQNTKLGGDLSNCSTTVGGVVIEIVIGAPDITLDLGGHTIDGIDVGVGVDNTAGYDNVTIKNGRIRQFDTGVSLDNASQNRLRELFVSHNSEGIVLFNSESNQIERNIISDNNNTGITLTMASNDNRIDRNSSVDNVNFGIAVEQNSNDNRIRRNTASDNQNSGIFVQDNSAGTLIEDNATNRNGMMFEHGIQVANNNPATILRNNTANNNADLGIFAEAGVTDGGGNRATGNGNALQCMNVTCF